MMGMGQTTLQQDTLLNARPGIVPGSPACEQAAVDNQISRKRGRAPSLGMGTLGYKAKKVSQPIKKESVKAEVEPPAVGDTIPDVLAYQQPPTF
mmetsp:Transcript_113536/g.197216  ORF Transcript_113536/g.197216 Transcript_113536/m.197216 type:complete len:94 (-) Transcript_113536:303-584(-)